MLIIFDFFKQTQQEWQIIFIITSIIYLIGFVAYSLFSESDTQKWAIEKSASQVELKNINRNI